MFPLKFWFMVLGNDVWLSRGFWFGNERKHAMRITRIGLTQTQYFTDRTNT